MPELVFSTKPIPSQFIGGRAFPVQPHIDYESGPIAIQDPSKGNEYQVWRSRMENNFVYLSAPNTPEFIVLDLPKVTEISFTFDQNANLCYVYVQDDLAYMYWYDTSIGDYRTDYLGDGVITPRVSLDDKRSTQTSISDVLLFYQKGSNLYMKQQRDRYLIEHLVATGCTDGVVKCGMMRNWRFGVQLAQYVPATPVF